MAPRENGITSFGLRNFKAFRYLEDIELKPLTLLVGANSSGKSSIFQSLLLLKQSLLSSSGGGPLKFDGDWVKLGGFGAVVSDFDTANKLEYRFSVTVPVPTKDTSALQNPPYVPVNADVVFSVAHALTGSPTVLGDLTIELRDDSGNADLHAEYLKIHSTRTEAYVVGRTTSPMALPDSGSGKVLSPLISFISLIPERYETSTVRTLSVHDVVLARLREALSNGLDYLGPVRADPRPFYPVSEDADVGPRGEGAIPFLLRHRADEVTYSPGPTEELAKATLSDALNHWLRRMRITDGLTISPVESIAYTAAVQTSLVKSRPVNLSQVGFGISQILPVLIQGLRNPPNAWILFEQPEIHLHPRLQGELGDFFLACARTGKTLMVETHSDHMVHRIRRRIAEDTTGELANLVQILFVHPGTEENPGSHVEPLRVAPDGSIENWPEDFLQDAADEAWAILRARQARSNPGVHQPLQTH